VKNLSQVIRAFSGRFVTGVLLASIPFAALPLATQLPSQASLKGAYYVRYLGLYTEPSSNLCALNPCRVGFAGTMTFDGNGNYQLAGQGITPSGASTQSALKVATSGQYFVNTSGWFGFSSPFDPAGKAWLQGGIGAGAAVIVASSGGWNYFDFFVGIPVSAGASSATLKGKYYIAGLAFWSGAAPSHSDEFTAENALFSMTADGQGGLSNVTVKSENGAAPGPHTSSNASYALNPNGSGMLSLPAAGPHSSDHLLAGDKVLYVSSDGNFFIAGGSSDYELVLGVKAFAGNTPNNSVQGTYFRVQLNRNTGGITSSAGAVSEISSLKVELADEWDVSTQYGNYDSTYQQDFTFSADGTRSTADNAQVVGAGGMFVIGTNASPTSSHLSLRVKAPAMGGSGVFLNPQGVVNAANNAPFTSNVAPGELILLYGSGLASQSVTASTVPLPLTLGGVQVSIGGLPAPLYFVSPTVISALVPYSFPADYSYQDVQVINQGAASNPVQVTARQTSPGIFTVPAGGIGNGAILHAVDYRLVSQDSPAKAGETVALYMTGLGVVSPLVADGAAGPTNPLSWATQPSVYIDGIQTKVRFAGLAPMLAGLYQLNLTIPSGVTTGNKTIEIDTHDGTTTMATIPIGK
jgi:uncharacterized protein (TIGR03437 family)